VEETSRDTDAPQKVSGEGTPDRAKTAEGAAEAARAAEGVVEAAHLAEDAAEEAQAGQSDAAVEVAAAKATGQAMRQSAGRVIRRYLITGLLVLLPVAVTAFVLWRLFFALDDILGRFVETYIGRPLPGVGLIALIALVMGIGAIASNFIGKRLILAGEGIVTRVPLMGWVYRTTKQLFSTILEERTSFRKVVLVSYPQKGMYSVAFLTSESPTSIEEGLGTGYVTVFLPTTPNPTSGILLVVPATEIVPLDMTVDEGLRLVISAGALAKRSGK
jgi:uncharacterized membrane protein